MFNFFIDNGAETDGVFIISGADYNHIKNVLRMRVGDSLLVSCDGASHLCAIERFEADAVAVKIIEKNFQNTSLPISVTLFQGLPKGDKLELIIQKAVELGADRIVPVEMSRSVVKIEPKKREAKRARWQAVAESASKQSKRVNVPEVLAPIPFKLALEMAKELDLMLVPYESKEGMQATANALAEITAGMKVGVFIGPEGGFDDGEIALAENAGGKTVSLGKRILRTETAAITALSMLMLYAEIKLYK